MSTTNTDMPFDLIASKARCEAASKGPWRHIAADNLIEDAEGFIAWQARSLACSVEQRDANGAFIAHARADLPAAIARIERAEASNAALAAELRELRQTAARMFAAIDQNRIGRVPVRMAQLRKLVATA